MLTLCDPRLTENEKERILEAVHKYEQDGIDNNYICMIVSGVVMLELSPCFVRRLYSEL